MTHGARSSVLASRLLMALLGCVEVHAARAGMPAPASGQTLTRLADGRLLILGGVADTARTAALLDPTTDVVRPLPRLHQARAWHTATLLASGRVLVLGGFAPGGRVVQAVEVFDPVTRDFTIVPARTAHRLPSARALHTATLLLDGRVLIAGGVGGAGTTVDRLELWDPAQATATEPEPRLPVARYGHTAILVGGATVALWGGLDGAGSPFADGALVSVGSGLVTPLTTRPDGPEAAGMPASVAEALPTDGAVGVARDSRVALRFSRPIDPTTVTAETFQVRSARGIVRGRLVVAEEGRLVFLTPRHPLRAAATYEVVVAGVRCPDGVAVDPAVIRFTTALAPSSPSARLPQGAAVGTTAGGRSRTPSEPADIAAAAPATEEWEPSTRPGAGWRTGQPASPWQALPARRAAAGVTAVAGQVLRLNGTPLEGVTLQIDSASTATDATGRFLLPVPRAGAHELRIDGRSASTPGHAYGVFEVWVDVQAGETTVLPYTIWMPKLDRAHAVTVPTPTGDTEAIVTTPKIPGLEVRIPPRSVVRDHDGNVVTELSITPIPLDRPPFPLPQHVEVPIYFTVQPGGAYVVNDAGAGARILYPNYDGQPPGTRFDFWHFDAGDRGGWYRYGRGAVTPDGGQVAPDPGHSVYEFTGAMVTGGTGPDVGPPPGACMSAGDPVDLATGLLVLQHTDLALPDVMPLQLTRTYRPGDTETRAFGKGTTHPYEAFTEDLLRGTPDRYTMADFVTPDGGRVRFRRTNCTPTPTSECNITGAVLEHREPTPDCLNCSGTPTPFMGATLVKLGGSFGDWELTLRNGTVYTFPLDTPVSAIRDRYGNTITLERPSLFSPHYPFADRVWSPNGHRFDFTYASAHCPTCVSQVQDDAGRVVQYSYDTNKRLVCVRDPEGGITTFAYDDTESQNADRKSRLKTMWDPKQNATCSITSCTESPAPCGTPTLALVYWGEAAGDPDADGNGTVRTETLADGVSTYNFTYNMVGGRSQLTTVTDPVNTVRQVTFNANGYCETDTDAATVPALQRTVTYGRESGTNRILSATEPLSTDRERQRIYTYEPLTGNVATVTVKAGPPGGSLTTVQQRSYTYEPRFNQLARVTDVLTGHTTSVTYEPADRLAKPQAIVDATNRRFPLTVDDAGRVTAVADPLGHTFTFTYQGGDLVTVTDPTPQTTRYAVDAAGRVRSVTDPQGHRTLYEYDTLGRLRRVTDPLGGSVAFDYDPNGNLQTVTDQRHNPAAITTYHYDPLNRLDSRTDPLARQETFGYDGLGGLLWHRDRRGITADFNYDARGRRTCAGFGRVNPAQTDCAVGSNYESTITYAYDLASRPTTITDSGWGGILRGFDDLDQVAFEWTSHQGIGQGIIFYYPDAANRRGSMSATGQARVYYCYDEADRLKEIRPDVCGGSPSTALVSVTYDDAGRRSSLKLPNGVTATYGYDSASRVSSLQYQRADMSVIGGLTYSYDAAGNRDTQGGSLAATGLPDLLTAATYDAADQLKTWNGPAPVYQYDANGNLQTDGANTYEWNKRNQLATIKDAVSMAVTASFKYDGLSRRAEKTVPSPPGSATTRFLYDGLNPVQELSATNGVVANLLTGLDIDAYVSRTEVATSTRRAFLADVLGSTIRLADDAGTVQTTYTYEPFGKTTAGGSEPSSTNAFQFTGRENDGTGLYYYRARYYAPTFGRFISEDPVGRILSPNLYDYAHQNPVTFRDPLGLYVSCIGVGGTGGGGGGGASISVLRCRDDKGSSGVFLCWSQGGVLGLGGVVGVEGVESNAADLSSFQGGLLGFTGGYGAGPGCAVTVSTGSSTSISTTFGIGGGGFGGGFVGGACVKL